MTAPQTVADVLDAAADRVSRGWGQGGYVPTINSECPCMGYAILWELPKGMALDRDVMPFLSKACPFRSASGMVLWNDAPGRTQSEVVAALRAAATSARQGETK